MLRFKIYIGKLDTEKGGYLDPVVIPLGSQEIEFSLNRSQNIIYFGSTINFSNGRCSVLHEMLDMTDFFFTRNIRIGNAEI